MYIFNWNSCAAALFVALICCAALAGCNGDQPNEDQGGPTSQTMPEPTGLRVIDEPLAETPPADAPSETVELTTLIPQLREGQPAEDRYAGKWVETTGTVSSIWADDLHRDNELVAMLQFDSDEGFCICYMAADEVPWEEITRGETATVRGVVNFEEVIAHPVECEITQGGTPTPHFTVDELMATFTEDPNAFCDQHSFRDLAVVTGKYIGIVNPPPGEEESRKKWIGLEGESGEHFVVGVRRISDFEGVQEGAEIQVLASFFYIARDLDVRYLLALASNVTPFQPEE